MECWKRVPTRGVIVPRRPGSCCRLRLRPFRSRPHNSTDCLNHQVPLGLLGDELSLAFTRQAIILCALIVFRKLPFRLDPTLFVMPDRVIRVQSVEPPANLPGSPVRYHGRDADPSSEFVGSAYRECPGAVRSDCGTALVSWALAEVEDSLPALGRASAPKPQDCS